MRFETSDELGEELSILICVLLLQLLDEDVLKFVQILDGTQEMMVDGFDVVSPVHDDEGLFVLLEDGVEDTFIRLGIDFAVDVGLASVHVLELGDPQCQHVLQHFFLYAVEMVLVFELLDHILEETLFPFLFEVTLVVRKEQLEEVRVVRGVFSMNTRRPFESKGDAGALA